MLTVHIINFIKKKVQSLRDYAFYPQNPNLFFWSNTILPHMTAFFAQRAEGEKTLRALSIIVNLQAGSITPWTIYQIRHCI